MSIRFNINSQPKFGTYINLMPQLWIFIDAAIISFHREYILHNYFQIFDDLKGGLEKAVIEYDKTKSDPNDSVVKEAVDSLQSVSHSSSLVILL